MTTKGTKRSVRVIVPKDEAYRIVFADGALAIANKIEQVVYSCESADDLLADLHRLVTSAHALADDAR